MDNSELRGMIHDAIRKQLPYAAFVHGPDRAIAEWAVASAFSHAGASESPGPRFKNSSARCQGKIRQIAERSMRKDALSLSR